MKKRLLFITLALCLAFSLCLLAGCAQSGTSSNSSGDSPLYSSARCAHEYGEWETNSYATCSREGWQTRTCSKCGETEWAEIAKTQHVTEIIPATEATCYSTGNEAGAKCSVCGEILVYPQTIQKKEHDYGEWINDEAATCTKDGERHKECKTEGCNSRIDDVIPATGAHDYVNVGDKCSICGELKPSEGLEFSNEYWNGYYVSSKGTCKDLNTVIPSTYNSKPVVGIADSAFKNRCDFETIVIPESVKYIDAAAFSSCKLLKNVTIPSGVEYINTKAFENCENLESVTLPDGLKSIGYGAFWQCYKLTSIIIPDSVTEICLYAFRSCSSLTSVTIGKDLKAIEAEAFLECPISEIRISGLSSWCNILLGEYYGGYDLDSNYDLYLNDELVTDLSIPDSVTQISDYAFYRCSSINSVIIPDSVVYIGKEAFYNCDGLTSVIIPDSVISIGENAFGYNENLTIYCEAESKPSGWSDGWNYSSSVVWGYKAEE